MTLSEPAARAALIAAMHELDAPGLNVGTTGNASCRVGEGVLITPSGVPVPDLDEHSPVLLGPDGTVCGQGRPSSEWRFHVDLFEARPEVGAIVHTHSTFATALACTGRGIPPFHYMVAAAGGSEIPLADYATFGTAELSANVAAALSGCRACLVANHGVVALGDDLGAAVTLAAYVENLAQMYVVTLGIGGAQLLDDTEMARVVAKFQGYGVAGHGRSH